MAFPTPATYQAYVYEPLPPLAEHENTVGWPADAGFGFAYAVTDSEPLGGPELDELTVSVAGKGDVPVAPALSVTLHQSCSVMAEPLVLLNVKVKLLWVEMTPPTAANHWYV
jgi:hypothetical protein